jgi:hypothetical protein
MFIYTECRKADELLYNSTKFDDEEDFDLSLDDPHPHAPPIVRPLSFTPDLSVSYTAQSVLAAALSGTEISTATFGPDSNSEFFDASDSLKVLKPARESVVTSQSNSNSGGGEGIEAMAEPVSASTTSSGSQSNDEMFDVDTNENNVNDSCIISSEDPSPNIEDSGIATSLNGSGGHLDDFIGTATTPRLRIPLKAPDSSQQVNMGVGSISIDSVMSMTTSDGGGGHLDDFIKGPVVGAKKGPSLSTSPYMATGVIAPTTTSLDGFSTPVRQPSFSVNGTPTSSSSSRVSPISKANGDTQFSAVLAESGGGGGVGAGGWGLSALWGGAAGTLGWALGTPAVSIKTAILSGPVSPPAQPSSESNGQMSRSGSSPSLTAFGWSNGVVGGNGGDSVQ